MGLHRICVAWLLAVAGFASGQTADGSPTCALQACNELVGVLAGKVAFDPWGPDAAKSAQLETLYKGTQANYSNAANSFDRPTCMVFPSDAEEVATTIKALDAYPDVRFALKSGGHNWNRAYSSTNGGILISFRPNLQSVTVSHDRKTAAIGPGAKWRDVMAELDKYDRCVVGGRDDDVGVGGYIVLGGLSYLTGQYGFASDNVVSFEVVLANGTIVEANEKRHPDLYFALRGGGNNFGVVTKYTVLAHPVSKVWGGPRIYTADKAPQLISAISNYVTNFDTSVAKSALLPTIAWVPALLPGTNIWTVFMFWDGETPPAHVFKEFLDIEALEDLTKVQRYPSILNLSSYDYIATGRATDRVGPLANLPHDNMTEFLTWHYEQANAAPFINNTDLTLFNMALQPIPVDLQKAWANGAGGPAAFRVDPSGGDKIWVEYGVFWKNASNDAAYTQQLEDLVVQAQGHQQTTYAGILPTKYDGGQLPFAAYNPIFANDAQNGQNIYESLGMETWEKLRDIRIAYDPALFFQSRTNGLHLELAPIIYN